MSVASPLLHEWLLEHAARRPEAPALATPALRLAYGEVAERVGDLAAHLHAAGVRRGDRVLAALPNTPATVIASLAVHALGGVAVEVNREWSADVQAEIVARTGVRHAFVWGRDARTWARARAGRPLDRL
ncbi:MAG TPA: AMP-binding protein, partial [Anaeromyxobacter sp.]